MPDRVFNKFYNTGTWGTLALNVISGVALLLASAWFVNNLLATRDAEVPPRVVNSIELEPTLLLAGKVFHAHVNATINKLCPYEVHWSLVRKTDGVEEVKIIEPVHPPQTALGTQDLPVIDRYVPNSVSPGDYRYVVEVFDLCGDGRVYTSLRRSVDITIR